MVVGHALRLVGHHQRALAALVLRGHAGGAAIGILAENLSNLLATDRVVQFPYPRAIVPDYQILVEVMQFHVTSEGKSLLQTNWQLVQDEKTILLKKSNLALPADTHSYATMVSAQSEALAALSREIASALQAVAHRTTARSIRPARKLQGTLVSSTALEGCRTRREFASGWLVSGG